MKLTYLKNKGVPKEKRGNKKRKKISLISTLTLTWMTTLISIETSEENRLIMSELKMGMKDHYNRAGRDLMI